MLSDRNILGIVYNDVSINGLSDRYYYSRYYGKYYRDREG